jgi:hypothetical protein
MTFRKQLQWGGFLIMVVALLVSITNAMIYAGKHNVIIQAVHAVGYTGLIMTCTIIHITQSRRAGLFGLIAYLLSVLCLVYVNVETFLTLAGLAGIQGMEETLNAVLGSMTPALYTMFVGLILLGISVSQAGVLPRWGGILMALGMVLQLPAQFAINLAGPMFFIFTIGGSILAWAGLFWIGWALWSGKVLSNEEPRLSNLDRVWGAPFILFASTLMVVNAYLNSFADLTLLDGFTNLLNAIALILTITLLYTAQADRSGGLGLAGFFCTHLGSTLMVITAYLIFGQLAGQIADNRALMASWVEIPVGRYGSYMVMLGTLLFGFSVIRAGVFPGWTGWLVVIGLALLLPSQFQTQDYLFSVFWAIGATLEGVGLGWMGWALFKKKDLHV